MPAGEPSDPLQLLSLKELRFQSLARGYIAGRNQQVWSPLPGHVRDVDVQDAPRAVGMLDADGGGGRAARARCGHERGLRGE